ncbi:iron-containing alcohol dehydrogenase [uncultured Microbulbifer sp.]|uniref:iron-containing alcohol dehydrogenase n=1 Tax=uncultured Microbulbifer sp. TaxID=348147 RepID=UPI0025DA8C81|nr:iron-containing alcohol dehydrogenase [uncultured Microbulbifer sp.]
MQDFDFSTTRTIVNRVGAAQRLADLCRTEGAGRVLLVTDAGIVNAGLLDRVLPGFDSAGMHLGIFDRVEADPKDVTVEAAVHAARALNAELVVGFGGGSSMDVAKLVAVLAHPGSRQSLEELYGLDNIRGRRLPLIQVPTTAGTGSEVGRSSVFTDEAAQRKKIIFHPRMLPEIVLLDPELTLGLPPQITAATGMDALSHNLEAYCSNSFHPMAEGIALEAMRLIHMYLPRAVADGSDLEARMQMLAASSMGATAFQRGLGAMHALAHPLGALYDKHHGLLNAILMPYVLAANRETIEEPMSRLSRYLALPQAGFVGVLDWVLFLRRDLGIPNTLSEIGIDASQADKIGAMAAIDPSAASNPLPLGRDGYRALFLAACEGHLLER